MSIGMDKSGWIEPPIYGFARTNLHIISCHRICQRNLLIVIKSFYSVPSANFYCLTRSMHNLRPSIPCTDKGRAATLQYTRILSCGGASYITSPSSSVVTYKKLVLGFVRPVASWALTFSALRKDYKVGGHNYRTNRILSINKSNRRGNVWVVVGGNQIYVRTMIAALFRDGCCWWVLQESTK